MSDGKTYEEYLDDMIRCEHCGVEHRPIRKSKICNSCKWEMKR